jgi:hypothetical protein
MTGVFARLAGKERANALTRSTIRPEPSRSRILARPSGSNLAQEIGPAHSAGLAAKPDAAWNFG